MVGNENNCTACNEIISDQDDDYYACDSCLKKIHKECAGLNASEVRCMPIKKRVLLFVCDDCRMLMVRMPYIVKVLDEIKRDVQEIKERNTERDKIQQSKSYSEALNNESTDLNRKARSVPALMIKPKSIQDPKKTREEIERSIDPTQLKVGIRSVRTTKQGTMIVKCATKHEIDVLKEAAENSLKDIYEIETPRMRSPRIKIVGFTGEQTAEEIERCIRRQNDWIADHDKLEVTFLKKIKKKNETVIFAECSPGLFNKMMRAKRLFIDWTRYPVYEDLTVTRCFNCQGFYHKSSGCNKKKTCSSCAGEHDSHDCESDLKKCRNCLTANSLYKTKYDVKHSADDLSCPSYKYHLEILRSRVNYTT